MTSVDRGLVSLTSQRNLSLLPTTREGVAAAPLVRPASPPRPLPPFAGAGVDEEDEDEEDSGEEQDAEDGDDADEDAEMMIDGQEELTAVDDAQLGVDDDEEEPDDTHNSHMLGDSDDMELPQLHDSDDEELMALEDQLHSH